MGLPAVAGAAAVAYKAYKLLKAAQKLKKAGKAKKAAEKAREAEKARKLAEQMSKRKCGASQACKTPKGRDPNRIGKRIRFGSRKEAYEAAKKAGGGKEPRLDYNDPRGPHYHPDVPKTPGQMTPNQASPHDHYFFPKGK
jgi:hypothetical protein